MKYSKMLLPLSVAMFASLALAQQGIISADMDPSVDPCTNFYDYANGSWRQKNPVPDYMDRWSRRWESGELNKEHVRDILEDEAKRADWPQGSAAQLSGDFYAACMNQGQVDQLGTRPALPLVKEVQSIKSLAQLERMIGTLHGQGIFVPFSLNSGQDLHEPTSVIAQITAAGLGLPDRDYYLKPETRFVEARAKYLVHVEQMFILAGHSPSQAKAAANQVFEFEKRLAQASLDNVALRDPTQQDHKMHFADLEKLTPHFDWKTYFDHAGLARSDLNVLQPKFMKEFNHELVAAPLKQWRVYLEWQILHSNADQLPEGFVKENFNFYGRYLSGATQMKPRWKSCAETTDSLLGEALGQSYVNKYFPPEAKLRVQAMVKNILAAMHDRIVANDWMSEQTKSRALEKLATFQVKIGYPDRWKQYQGLTINRISYWDDKTAASRWSVADDRAQIGKPVDRIRWDMTPPTSNAYYNPFLNEIVFPAGILQSPAFNMAATDAVNYGAIGVVIGHEITHGFDDQGAQFDATGKLSNWWTDDDHKKFNARGACVANQFEAYFIEPGIHHNGKLVLGESIADLGGAKLAFLAYQKSREGKGPESTIDGFTPEQQFFLGWGQFRGDETRTEAQRKMVQGDPHPVAKFRVTGPLSNLPAFSDSFSCKPGSAMLRPESERCDVW